MLVDIVEDEKAIALVVDCQPSVCVGVGGKPGRRLGVEITTQDDVGCVSDSLYVW